MPLVRVCAAAYLSYAGIDISLCRGEGETLSEEIKRRQRIIAEQLAELKQITARLTPEERKALDQAISQTDADTQERGVEQVRS
jgi:hypothetical protein